VYGIDPTPGPWRSARSGHQSLVGIVAAIEQHRRLMARLVDGLGDLGRAAAPDGAGVAEGESSDASTLMSSLVGRLRLDDLRLERLADDLERQVRSDLLHHATEERPHAHALRPLP
jgi:hypothetical protein